MTFLVAIASVTLMVWAVIALVRGTVFLSTALFLVATCCFPAEFFAVDAGGLTWTLDRVWFLVLVAQATLVWYRGEQNFFRLEHCDVAVLLFFLWLVARTVTQPLGAVIPGQPPTLMHLVNGFFIPFVLYAILRTTKLDAEKLKSAWWVLAGLGLYLALTAFLEVGRVWGLVFPRFIADPDLGIHFGRARGPMLQSVRLGMCLLASWVSIAVYTVWMKPECRFRWAAFASASVLFSGAVYFTYTRSVWLGLVLCVAILTLLALQGMPRRVAIFGMAAGCMLIGAVKGPDLIAFKREFSAAETRESTYMRTAFAYVSIKMFQDRPVAGFGFNQFQVYNTPYLADRSTNIRLNSIRGYVHHNSFLSLLVDLGLVGIALYGFMALTLAAQAWTLWRAQAVPRWVRGLALIAFAVGGTHLIQMAFHEVTLSSIENSLLFAICGLVVAANQQYCYRPDQTRASQDEQRT